MVTEQHVPSIGSECAHFVRHSDSRQDFWT